MSPVAATSFVPIGTAAQPDTRQAMSAIVNGKSVSHPTTEKISVRNLNFYYEDGNQALRNVTVPIYDKCVTAPRDCGKAGSAAAR